MRYRKPRVLVIGDLILDLWCEVEERYSNPEGAAMITSGYGYKRMSTLGGAGLVATLLKSLGASVKLMARAGTDEASLTIHGLLHENGLSCKNVIFRDDHLTPVKMRFVNTHGVVVFRYDEEEPTEDYLEEKSPDFNFDKFSDLVQKADCVVIADYGKGFCQEYGPKIIEAARYYGALTVVGAKPIVLEQYAGADIVKVNASEAVDFLSFDGLDLPKSPTIGAQMLCEKLQARAAIITASRKGTYYARKDDAAGYTSFSAPAKSCFPAVLNCVGAGDAYLAGLVAELMRPPRVVSPGFRDKPLEDLRLHTAVASAAAVAAQYLSRGFPEVDPATPYLASFVRRTEETTAAKIVSRDEAQLLCQAWRSIDEKVVFTNGCFDLLHRGHLHLLEQAKRQGTRLIVAVNSDESVRLLKGSQRPVQDFDTRAQVIASLGCVDAVVVLDEDDFDAQPVLRAMISDFLPDVLVKGAQYKESDIVGWEEMVNRDSPGRVWRCPMVDNCSTTNTVSKIQQHDT